MEIKCEKCNNTNWKMIIYEMKVFGQSVIYSALKCEGCGMVYPLTQLAKNQPRDSVVRMLESS